jgi:hypothetical protein
MTKANKLKQNLPLLLPAGLLLLEITAIVVIIASGYEVTTYFFFFAALLSFFLIYQIGQQLTIKRRVNKALKDIDKAEDLINDGKTMAAIKLWKDLLISLPKKQYLNVLSRMESTYQEQAMSNAVKQVKIIKSKSKKFFEMTGSGKKLTPKERQAWQSQALELQNMVHALPEDKASDIENPTYE